MGLATNTAQLECRPLVSFEFVHKKSALKQIAQTKQIVKTHCANIANYALFIEGLVAILRLTEKVGRIFS